MFLASHSQESVFATTAVAAVAVATTAVATVTKAREQCEEQKTCLIHIPLWYTKTIAISPTVWGLSSKKLLFGTIETLMKYRTNV